MFMANKPQRFKTASGREIIDLGACFDNDAAHGVGLLTLSASEPNTAPTGQPWKIGAPLVIRLSGEGGLR